MPAGGVAGARKPCVRLSETRVAFARVYSRRVETLVAFARAGRASTETVIAFAGEKWVFFVRFSVAEASSVSTVAIQGRAKVTAVSRWPASAVAEVLLVSAAPCWGEQWCRRFHRRHISVSCARNLSPCTA